MATLSIIEHLNVVEKIGPSLLSGSIANTVHALPLEQPKEALDDGIEAPIFVNEPDALFLACKCG